MRERMGEKRKKKEMKEETKLLSCVAQVKENCAFTYLNQIIIQFNVMYLPMYISLYLYWRNDNEIWSLLAHLLHKIKIYYIYKKKYVER